MRKNHLIGCIALLVLAAAVALTIRGSIAGMGILLVAVVCPIAMFLAIWLVLGRVAPAAAAPADGSRERTPTDGEGELHGVSTPRGTVESDHANHGDPMRLGEQT
jgi:hypothetical protein